MDEHLYATVPLSIRHDLARCGSVEPPALEDAQSLLENAGVPLTRVEPACDPPAAQPPELVSQTLTPRGQLSAELWQSLNALERFVVHELCAQGSAPLLHDACAEIFGQKHSFEHGHGFTHLRAQGGVVMVSVADKPETRRLARAESWLTMNRAAFTQLQADQGPKRDILATARVAGIQATKKASDLIPLCHPLPLLHAEVDFELHASTGRVRVTCSVIVVSRTGVEMEALCGVQVAALTLYDMLKSVDRSMVMGPSRLLEKSGGRSGVFRAPDDGLSP